ncbi:MAG: PAS domain S-box protein [Actinobacteria bacterium]|nr:PAS domain S-box protein [Actinomycetota bacterium]
MKNKTKSQKPEKTGNAQMAESEEKYRLIVEHANEAILVAQDNCLKYVNPKCIELLDYTRDELIEEPFLNFVHPEDMAKVAERYKRRISGKGIKDRYIFRIIGKKADVKWVEINTVLFSWKNRPATLNFLTDVTERINTQKALKESEERFRLTFHASPDAITISRLEDGLYVDVNDGFVAQSGYTRQEIIGKTSKKVNIWENPQDRERLVSGLQHYGFVNNLEAKFRLKNGNIITGLMSAKVMKLNGVEHILSVTRNIEAMKQTEEALRLSKEFSDNLIESANAIILTVDENADISTFNHYAEKLTGYTKEEVLGKNLFEKFIPELDFPDVPTIFKRILQNMPETSTHEDPILCKDGTQRLIDWKDTILSDDDGTPKGVLSIGVDITERRETEAALRQSEQRFRQLFDEAPVGYHEIDTRGHIVRVNSTELNLLGYSREEMLGKPIWDFIFEEDTREEILTKLHVAVRSDNSYERTFICKNGSYLPVMVEDRILQSEGRQIVGLRSTIHDISERKIFIQALQDSEEKYRRFFEDDLTGDYISTPEGKILFCNPAFAQIFGFESVDEAMNSDAVSLYPNSKDRQDFLSLLEKEKKLEYHEIELCRTDGKPVYVIQNVIGSFDEEGKLYEMRGYLFDITTLKNLETQLRQAQKMEAIGTLAGGIAHDFNNILGAIIGYTELTMDDLDEESNIYNNLENVIAASFRAKELVKQILTFSRLDKIEKKPVQINPIVKETIKLLRASLPTTIEIKQHIPNKASYVQADPVQIQQIVLNLGTNAAHAMQDNGGRLCIDLSEINLDSEIINQYKGLAAGSYVELKVSDTGHGITRSIMNRIFDPFFTTKDVGEGTGMGLSVIHGIVHGLNGQITVESEVGKGTTFSVFLPRFVMDETREKKENKPLPRGQERILYIDDEVALVQIAVMRFTDLGYDIVGKTDSLEAMELFRADPDYFDLIITDQTLPGLTGKELAKNVRKIRPGMPIILCTGYSNSINPKEAKKIGIKKCIYKPVSMREMPGIVRRVLDDTREIKVKV